MLFRRIVSLSLGLSFCVLLGTGILSYVYDYSRTTATLHTAFGILFTMGVFFHLRNNLRPLIKYAQQKILLPIFLLTFVFFYSAYLDLPPFVSIMDFGTSLKVGQKKELNHSLYEVLEMNIDNDVLLGIDMVRAEHYWHPQMAIWIEDTSGVFMETLFVSKATAKGLFYGGRSKDNFKEFDQGNDATGAFRRVDALPVWSHKRGVQYPDGMYVPPNTQPLPDGITGATIKDNFKLFTSTNVTSNFVLKIELNVAFDDNEFYSAFDFPDDTVYHSGTGLLGQPSIIFGSEIDLNDDHKYYLMRLLGHGHHSGQTGALYSEIETLTTAKQIVEKNCGFS